MAECTHDCASCNVEGCGERTPIEKLKPHNLSSFRKIIAVVSGKGGVGKSLVTELLAVSLLNEGKKVAILDADITGPSIPKAFGVETQMAFGTEDGIYPAKSSRGVPIISANLLIDDPTAPIIWRGPMIASLVGQLFSDVVYGEMEYLLIDMPPGTGDVPLTVFQQIPVDGVIIVSSPQELVSMVVEKSVNMCKMMDIKILGLVENMSYVNCPHCDEKIKVFGESGIEEVAKKHEIPVLGEIPIVPSLAKLVDKGEIESYKENYLSKAVKAIESL